MGSSPTGVMLLACCCLAVEAHGEAEVMPDSLKTIIEHRGRTDPKTEGWEAPATRIRVSGGTETIGDQAFPYWSIADTGGEDGAYSVGLAPEQMSRSWRITLVARVVDVGTERTGFGVVLLDGVTYWRLNLVRDGAVYDGLDLKPARYGKAFDTTNTYRRYELVLQPAAPGLQSRSDRVTLLVNGVEHARLRRGDFRRMRSASRLAFGSTNSSAKGELRYGSVCFEGDDSPVSPRPAEPDLPQPHPSALWEAAEGAWHVGSSKQLFIDHRLVESRESIRLVVNPPVKLPGCVIKSDKPWDAFSIIWFSIAEDGDLCKMWYQAYDKDQWGGGVSRMCYAVSEDGLLWEKPDLGLVEYDGSKENNILLAGSSKLAYVFIDPRDRPERRYKMLSGIGTTRMRTSPDGIHWTLHPQIVWNPVWDTQKQAWWDPRISKYVIQTRVQIERESELPFPFVSPIESTPPVVAPKLHRPVRALGRLEVDDIMEPWPSDRLQTVMTADEQDPPGSDIYHPGGVYQYPNAADAYFMFPLTYQHFRRGEGHPSNDGVNDAQFAASRDGIHWMRYDRRPFISRGLPGEPDCGMAAATGFFVRRGSRLLQYYTGWPWTHGGFRLLSPADRGDPKNWGRRFVGVAVHRLDGFVSADAPYTGGQLITLPMVFRGSRLELNINVAAMGAARVEIQDEDGAPIPRFTLEDCDRILMNDVAHVVFWQGVPDVSELAGRPVRLRFVMSSAKLYAFQFR